MRRPSGEKLPVKARGIGRTSGTDVTAPVAPTATDHSLKMEGRPGTGTVSRVDVKSTRLPSGLQPRAASRPGWKVRRAGSPPATGTTYTSVLPPTVAVKARRDPSGENRGSISAFGVDVSRLSWPPARGTVHRSPPYSNATRSRLIAGRRSSRVPCASAVSHSAKLVRMVTRIEKGRVIVFVPVF